MSTTIIFFIGFFFGWLYTVKKTWVIDMRSKMEKDINENIKNK